MRNRQATYLQPQINGASSVEPVYLHWWQIGSEQKTWPVPSMILLVGFFGLAIVAPVFAGRPGISLTFVLAAMFPFKELRRFLQKGDIFSILTVVIPVMTMGNFDALGDLWGSDVIRFSWPLLAFSAIIVAGRYKVLKGPVNTCCVVICLLSGLHIVSTIGRTSIIGGVEKNVAYALAFVVTMIALTGKKTRDPFIRQMCLVSVVNCGFCVFEILYPYSSITISSSRVGQVGAEITTRSAGLYANAIASGLLGANCLLLAAIGSTRTKPTAKEKISLSALMAITAIGVLATFSRSAALAYFMAVVMVAFRLSNNKFAKLFQYVPFVFILILISFFGVGEYLTGQGKLRGGGSKRYNEIKHVFGGDFGLVFRALEGRVSAWEPSRRLWRNAGAFGHGFGVIAEENIFPPHNMVILELAEVGWLGLLAFLATIFYFCGLGSWKMDGANVVLVLSILMPICLLIIESHSLLTRRYFSFYFVELVFATRVLFKQKPVQSRVRT